MDSGTVVFSETYLKALVDMWVAKQHATPTDEQRECMSKKIPILMDEGMPQEQAVAAAYNMCGVPEKSFDAPEHLAPQPLHVTITSQDVVQ